MEAISQFSDAGVVLPVNTLEAEDVPKTPRFERQIRFSTVSLLLHPSITTRTDGHYD
jgi:hypothetical protein